METYDNLDIEVVDYKDYTTKELLDERHQNEEVILKTQKGYKLVNFITNVLAIGATAGIITMVAAPNAILKLSGLVLGCASSIGAMMFMYNKKNLKNQMEYEIAVKKKEEINEELKLRFEDVIEELEFEN